MSAPTRRAPRRHRAHLVAVAALLASASPALAHTSVASTSPRAGAELASPPRAVVVTYSQPVGAIERARVEAGGRTLSGPARIARDDARRVVIPIRAAAAPAGGYLATWTVVGADGHALEGSLAFRVRPPRSAAALRALGAAITRAASAVEASLTSR